MAGARRIVVLGGGFAGVECARALGRRFRGDGGVEVVLVSRNNYLLFTPLLPQVASGALEMRHAVVPIRAVCGGVAFREAEVENIDPYGRSVDLRATVDRRAESVRYDYLVVALGGETEFFGMEDVAARAHGMKTLGDAVALRNRAIDVLEQADSEEDPIRRRAMLTFVIAGAGFAGVETAGELLDLLHDARRHYPRIRGGDFRVAVVEAGPDVLPGFDRKLARFARERLAARGVEFRTGTSVSGYDGREVLTERAGAGGAMGPGRGGILAGTLVWTAGVGPAAAVAASPLGGRGGRIPVDGRLAVPGFPGVFAAGDCAAAVDPATGRPYPDTAQCAEEQGRAAARNVAAAAAGGRMAEFSFRSRGQMASIGRRAAVASVLGANVSGFWAWFLWRTVYLSKIPSAERRVRVVLDWTVDLLFHRDISRAGGAPRAGAPDEAGDAWRRAP